MAAVLTKKHVLYVRISLSRYKKLIITTKTAATWSIQIIQYMIYT